MAPTTSSCRSRSLPARLMPPHQVLAQAPYLPLGQILQPTAYRRNLTDILPGLAKF